MHEIAKSPSRRVTVLSRGSSNETLPSAPLDPYGSKIIIDERSFLGGLQGVSFQPLMKCKEKGLIWEDGRPHWRNAKTGKSRRNPHGVEWMWMGGKRLVKHLQVYDTGQQEAMLRWLLLREFGQPMTCPFPWGEKRKEDWHDTFIMGQQGVWMHYDDMVILFSMHQLYDGGMMRQQSHLLLWRIGREQGKNFSHT